MSAPPWFYAPELHPGSNQLTPEESHHALHVRRLTPGHSVVLFDGRGRFGAGRLSTAAPVAERKRRAAPPQLTVDLIDVQAQPERHAKLTLIVPGCKGDRLGWLVEKCTQLGVHAIWFTRFARTVVPVEFKQLQKLQRLALETCKQCRRAWLPELRPETTLAEALDAWHVACPAAPVLYGSPSVSACSFANWRHANTIAQSAAAIVGPEGGLSDGELAQLRDRGALPLRLGPYILRVETAAVAFAAGWADGWADQWADNGRDHE